MATEIFTKADFEQRALPVHKDTQNPLWTPMGLQQGEEAYKLRIDADVSIEIRSSVDGTGICASTGEDSIRAWLVDSNGKPLGSKVTKYTTRRKGWDKRTKEVLRTLWGWRLKAGNCSCCGEPKRIFKVKKKDSPNKGRVFATCNEECGNQWEWLT